jgi:hypothetical protein
MDQAKVVDLSETTEFQSWIYDLYNPPSWDEDMFDLDAEPISAIEETRRQKFLSTEYSGSQLHKEGISWLITDAGIPYEYKINGYLIQTYIDCLVQQVMINDELDGDGNPIVHKLDQWRVMTVEISGKFGGDPIATQIVTLSNILAISDLRSIPLNQINGGIYDATTGEYVETTSGLDKEKLKQLLISCLDERI